MMTDHLKPVVLNLALLLCAAALLFRPGRSPIHASDDKVTKWNAAGLIIVNQTKKKVYDLHLILEYGESDAPTIAKVTVEKAAAYNAQSDAYQDPTGANTWVRVTRQDPSRSTSLWTWNPVSGGTSKMGRAAYSFDYVKLVGTQ